MFFFLSCSDSQNTHQVVVTDEGSINGPINYHLCECECGLEYKCPLDQYINNGEKCIQCEGMCLAKDINNVNELLDSLSDYKKK